MTAPDYQQNFAQWIARWIARRQPDATNLSITPFAPPSSGTSNDTRLFALHYNAPEPRSERLVLRTAPAGPGLFPTYDLSLEAGVMSALANAGLPVPAVRCFEPDASVIGAPFIIMDRVDGEVPSDNPPGFHAHGLFFDASEAERAAMWWETLDSIIAIHALDWRQLDLPPMVGAAPPGERWIGAHLDYLRGWLAHAKAEPLAVIERGLAWLDANIGAARPRALLWGDARPGNVLYRDGKVAALLDWEMTTVGMPESDVCYFYWSSEMLSEAHGVPRLAGLPSRDETYARYLSLTGKDQEVMRGAEIYTLTQISVMATLMAKASFNENFAQMLERNVAIRNLAKLLD